MTTSNKTFASISIVILCISLVVWVLLLANPGNIMTVEHCPVTDAGPSAASLQMLLDMNPLGSMLAGWVLMVIAMMLPKLIMPIDHIYERSFKRSRFFHSLLFVFGYVAVWTIVGVFMIAAILGLNLLMGRSYIPAIVIGAIALVWQFSPVKQRYLNRGHNHSSLAAFGWAANRDALMFGVMHGIWCVGSGWALMLFPMLLPDGHNLAMVLMTFVMLSEHLERPQAPRWRLAFRGKLFRIIFAQSQIKLQGMLNLG